jgi:hypothetical protein
MALALAEQQQNTPVSSFRLSAGEEPCSNYNNRVSTFFDEGNQWYGKTLLPFPYAPQIVSHTVSQGELIEMEEYRGFCLSEWGEIEVSYNKEGVIFLRNFKFICLNRYAHNKFYPDPYLVVCFELELEGSGVSKETALDNLCQLLDVYFNRTREIHKEPGDYAEVVTANIAQQNPWKQSFARMYKHAQKSEEINTDYQHQITSGE